MWTIVFLVGFCLFLGLLEQSWNVHLLELEITRAAAVPSSGPDNAPLLGRSSMGSTEEPERKRRHLNDHTISPPLKKQTMAPSPEEKKVDAAVLQFQNHKLAQQLEVQKTEFHALESKFNHLKFKQASYDDTLSAVHRAWKELVDDLELLAIKANVQPNGFRVLETLGPIKERGLSQVPEQTFLHRLLETGATESSTSANDKKSVEAALASRKASTVKTLTYLVQAVESQRAKTDELANALSEKLSNDDAGRFLKRLDDDIRAESVRLQSNLEQLHLKYKQISAEIGVYKDAHARDQSEISRLSVELEETSAELEANRRKLAALRSQKDMVSAPANTLTPCLQTIKSEQGEKDVVAEKVLEDTRQLEASLEEAKTLAARRLTELQESLQTQVNLSQKIQHMQDLLGQDQRILTSRPYLLLNEQVQATKNEAEKYRALHEQIQAERDNLLKKERELALKLEAGESTRKAGLAAECRVAELENQLQSSNAEKESLQLQLDDKTQSQGHSDSIREFKAMITCLNKEMGMMQFELNKFKKAAQEVHSLRAEVQSLSGICDRKTAEHKQLSDLYNRRLEELKLVKVEVGHLRDTEQELKLIVEMFGRESSDSRDILELQQAECKAWAQVERLKAALDEHSLELRVKAANEAEAACQQRLAAAESDIEKLRQQLDVSGRVALELKENLKAKDEEGEAYLAEIETIGQAYEDMQTQNQRLLQQLTERDDYNTQLVAESLKAKQAYASLQVEKNLLLSRIEQAHASIDLQKQRIARHEEQMRSYIEQLNKASDDSRVHMLSLESAKRKAADVERELASSKSALEASQKIIDERGQRIADVQGELEKERFDKRRLQEEVSSLNSKVERFSAHHDGNPLVEKLQDEIKEYRAILKCGVCHDRAKEVVITKCYHLFCSPCIQRNLELRHRKCPGCGVPFGQNDVRTVYI